MSSTRARAGTALGRAAVAAALIAISAYPAAAGIVAGGGARSTDCLGVFSTAAALPPGVRHLRCVDGDPTCDADLAVNGECVFPVAICVNSTQVPSCSISGVASMSIAHSSDNGDPKFDTAFQALQSRIDDLEFPNSTADECTAPTNVVVKLSGPFPGKRCRSGRKVVQMTTNSTFLSGSKVDRDALYLTCKPPPGVCDPQALFTGTFDRIQKQVLDTTCAVSGCHDSQSQTANLLLEVGASYAALVNAEPTNGVAAGLGWKRITTLGPTLGDPETSYLFHKITGDLDKSGALGGRMPLHRRPLRRFLVDIFEEWILAGAPETGWVPGTED